MTEERNWSEFHKNAVVVFTLGEGQWTGILLQDVFGLEDTVAVRLGKRTAHVPPRDLLHIKDDRARSQKPRQLTARQRSTVIIWYLYGADFHGEKWAITNDNRNSEAWLSGVPSWAEIVIADCGFVVYEAGHGRIGRLKATSQEIIDRAIELGMYPFPR